MFGTKNIKKSVWSAINKKINIAQKAHDEELVIMERNQKVELKTLETAHEGQKIDLFDKHVGSIIGKIM